MCLRFLCLSTTRKLKVIILDRMANLPEMGFPWHLSIICCPSTLLSLLQISFLLCSCEWCRFVLRSVFEYDSFILMYALFLIRESKAQDCFTTSEDQDILWSKGVQWRGCLSVDCPLLEKHQWISQFIFCYRMHSIDIFADSWFSRSHSLFSTSGV